MDYLGNTPEYGGNGDHTGILAHKAAGSANHPLASEKWLGRMPLANVALLSYFTLLGTVASIVQQFHTLIWWRDVKTEQYEYTVAHLGCPEIAIAGPSVGLDLVLFYIREF
ncbi:hypothetical protein AAE478_005344 [Parahypoxylon ruwenzoriense]